MRGTRLEAREIYETKPKVGKSVRKDNEKLIKTDQHKSEMFSEKFSKIINKESA